MNTKLIKIAVVVLVLFMVSAACGGTTPEEEETFVSPTYEKLADDSGDAGGYMAYILPNLSSTDTELQYYYWTPTDFILPSNHCVTVGSRTESIKLEYRYDFEWKKKGNDYCLVRR